jgi:hypothetical protein
MPLLLLSLFLLLVAGFCYLWQLVRANRGSASGSGRIRFLLLVQDQEPWVEGFFRKLFYGLRNVPQLKIQVFDSGSRDATAAILELLSRYYPLEVLAAGEVEGPAAVKGCGAAKEENGCYCADLRKLEGKALLKAASFLVRLN